MPRILLAALLLPLLQGCVVWDIRNEMRATNAKLADVKTTLDAANVGLDKANTRLDDVETGLKRLDRTNDLIGGVEQGMTRIDKTNTSLDTLQKQLDMLAAIEKSLTRLDAHLTAVRKALGSINSMIPFLDLGGGDDPGPVPAVAAGDAAPADAKPAEPRPDGEPAARRDALTGIWVSRYPDDRRAMLLMPDGACVWSTLSPPERGPVNGAPPEPRSVVLTGRWTHEGGVLTLTLDPPKAPAAAPGQPAPASAEPTVWKLKVVNSTARSVALQLDEKTLVLFGRP